MNIENSVKTFPTQETDKSTIISNDLTIASLDPSLGFFYESIELHFFKFQIMDTEVFKNGIYY